MKPSVARPGATASGRRSGPPRGSRTIGAAGLVDAPLGFRLEIAITADHVKIARHQRKRLGFAVLGCAQPRDRVAIGRVAGELVAAEALDRDDRAVGE